MDGLRLLLATVSQSQRYLILLLLGMSNLHTSFALTDTASRMEEEKGLAHPCLFQQLLVTLRRAAEYREQMYG